MLFRLFMILCPLLWMQVESSASEALKSFDTVVQKMNEGYYDQTFSGLDWKKLTRKTREKMEGIKDLDKQYAEIQRMLDKLGKSHLAFRPPGSKKKKFDFSKFMPKQIDFNIHALDGQWVITQISKDASIIEQGLKLGMQVHKIKHLDMPEAKADIDTYHELKKKLMFHAKWTLEMEVSYKDWKKPRTLKLRLHPLEKKVMRFGNIKAYDETHFEILEGNIGYIHFEVFLFETLSKTIEALKGMKDCKGVIIDLRDNPGGIGMLSVGLAKEFSKENYLIGTQIGKGMEVIYRVYGQEHAYEGPLVLLINGNTASTSEILARGMQLQKRATILGTRTAGMALPSIILELEDGSDFQYPIADFKDTKGQLLEHEGVKPDHIIKLKRQDLENNIDTQLQAALEVFNSKTKQDKGEKE